MDKKSHHASGDKDDQNDVTKGGDGAITWDSYLIGWQFRSCDLHNIPHRPGLSPLLRDPDSPTLTYHSSRSQVEESDRLCNRLTDRPDLYLNPPRPPVAAELFSQLSRPPRLPQSLSLCQYLPGHSSTLYSSGVQSQITRASVNSARTKTHFSFSFGTPTFCA